MTAQAPKKKALAPPKKTSLKDREYVNQPPSQDDINLTPDGAKYLSIDVIERDLDRWAWTTQNFQYALHNSNRGNFSITASIELVIPWNEHGQIKQRTLVGACNFFMGNYSPNGHFVATAKSECVKNAASDLGRRFGRGLNREIIPVVAVEKVPGEKSKMKPDRGIVEQLKRAKENGDETQIRILTDVYDFNTENNGL